MRRAVLFGAALAAALTSVAASASQPTSTCLAHPLVELPLNSWAPARAELAPPGASEIKLCRYGPFGNRRLSDLTATAYVRSANTIETLTRGLDGLPPVQRLAFCPMDDGAQIDMTLTYPAGHGVFIRVELTGCETVSNGSITRSAATTAAGGKLIATLESLAGTQRSHASKPQRQVAIGELRTLLVRATGGRGR